MTNSSFNAINWFNSSNISRGISINTSYRIPLNKYFVIFGNTLQLKVRHPWLYFPSSTSWNPCSIRTFINEFEAIYLMWIVSVLNIKILPWSLMKFATTAKWTLNDTDNTVKWVLTLLKVKLTRNCLMPIFIQKQPNYLLQKYCWNGTKIIT